MSNPYLVNFSLSLSFHVYFSLIQFSWVSYFTQHTKTQNMILSGILGWHPLDRQTSYKSTSSHGRFHSFDNQEQSATEPQKASALSSHCWLTLMMNYGRIKGYDSLGYPIQLRFQSPTQILSESTLVNSVGWLVHYWRGSPIHIWVWRGYAS